MKKCGFIGHRDACDIENKIFEEIKAIIETNDKCVFYSGGMGNFDKMCEIAVKKLNGKIVYIPYNIKQIKSNDKIWYDGIVCPFENKPYSKYDIPNRNKWLVDNCDILLCFVHKKGGAKNTFDYAISKHKHMINIEK